jgi:hypothetical protein
MDLALHPFRFDFRVYISSFSANVGFKINAAMASCAFLVGFFKIPPRFTGDPPSTLTAVSSICRASSTRTDGPETAQLAGWLAAAAVV